jgi:hypothetical protein
MINLRLLQVCPGFGGRFLSQIEDSRVIHTGPGRTRDSGPPGSQGLVSGPSGLATGRYCKGFDAGPPSGRGRVPEFVRVFALLVFSLDARPAFVPSHPYFRVCVLVAAFLSA